MNPTKTQIGESATANLYKNTWTFEMQPDFILYPGHFAIIPKEEYDLNITHYEAMKSALEELQDIVTGIPREICEKALESVTNENKE